MRGRTVGRVAIAEHALAPQAVEGAPQQPLATIQRQRAAPGVGPQAGADLEFVRVVDHVHQAEPAAEAPLRRFHQRQQRVVDLAIGMRLARLGQRGRVGRQRALGAPDARAFVPAVEIPQAGDEARRRGGLVQRQVVHQLRAHARVAVHVGQVIRVVGGKLTQAQPRAGGPGRCRQGRRGGGHGCGHCSGRQ